MNTPGYASCPPPFRFLDACADAGIQFERDDLARLQRFLELLLQANEHFNLTAITDPDQAWMRHIFDSLTLLPFVLGEEANSLVDVGSGGGMPGVPLAILLPALDVTLLESTSKKARFLEQAVAALELANVEVVCQRAETAGRDRENFREAFDIVTARAVGPLPVLLELTVPLARIGGLVLAMKGARAAAEIESAAPAMTKLKCHVAAVHDTGSGTIIAIEKLDQTPRMYPRAPGDPKRNPL